MAEAHERTVERIQSHLTRLIHVPVIGRKTHVGELRATHGILAHHRRQVGSTAAIFLQRHAAQSVVTGANRGRHRLNGAAMQEITKGSMLG